MNVMEYMKCSEGGWVVHVWHSENNIWNNCMEWNSIVLK